jgi:hypothetical protein
VLCDTETALRQIWSGGECRTVHSNVNDSDYLQATGWDEFAMPHDLTLILANHPAKSGGKRTKLQSPHERINRSLSAVAGSTGSIVLDDPHGANPLDPRERQRVLSIEGRDMSGEIHIGVHMDEQACFVNDGPWFEVEQTHAEAQALEGLHKAQEAAGWEQWIKSQAIAELIGKKAGAVQRTLTRRIAKDTIWKQFRVVSQPGFGFRLEKICP